MRPLRDDTFKVALTRQLKKLCAALVMNPQSATSIQCGAYANSRRLRSSSGRPRKSSPSISSTSNAQKNGARRLNIERVKIRSAIGMGQTISPSRLRTASDQPCNLVLERLPSSELVAIARNKAAVIAIYMRKRAKAVKVRLVDKIGMVEWLRDRRAAAAPHRGEHDRIISFALDMPGFLARLSANREAEAQEMLPLVCSRVLFRHPSPVALSVSAVRSPARKGMALHANLLPVLFVGL